MTTNTRRAAQIAAVIATATSVLLPFGTAAQAVVKKAPTMAFDASPEPVRAGGTLTLSGDAYRGTSGNSGRVDFYFDAAGGAVNYVKVGTTVSNSAGHFSKNVVATQSGSWQARFLGNATLKPASRADSVALLTTPATTPTTLTYDGAPTTLASVYATTAPRVNTSCRPVPDAGPDGVLGDNPATAQDEGADDIVVNTVRTETQFNAAAKWVPFASVTTNYTSRQSVAIRGQFTIIAPQNPDPETGLDATDVQMTCMTTPTFPPSGPVVLTNGTDSTVGLIQAGINNTGGGVNNNGLTRAPGQNPAYTGQPGPVAVSPTAPMVQVLIDSKPVGAPFAWPTAVTNDLPASLVGALDQSVTIPTGKHVVSLAISQVGAFQGTRTMVRDTNPGPGITQETVTFMATDAPSAFKIQDRYLRLTAKGNV